MGRTARFGFLAVVLSLGAAVLGHAQGQPPSQANAQPNFYAVIIGVSEFSELPKEEWLDYADDDARAFHQFVTSPRGRGFLPENVFLLTNEEASFQAIRSRLGSTLAKKIKPEDTVYIFIATHGMVEREAAREGYLLGYDSDREDLYSSALPMRELGTIMSNRLRTARRVLLFADACRAGKLGQAQGSVNRYIEDVSRQRGEVMGLLASRPNEFSREGSQFGGGHGVFTYYLLKGLMGEADADKDNTVTAAEIVSYLQTNVEDATERQQHIRDFGDFEPDTPLAFVDKEAPAGLKLAQRRRRWGVEVASLQGAIPQGVEVLGAFERALDEGRLVNPPGENAWELYQRFEQLPVPETQKEDVQEELLIALATAGDRVLGAYRRGDAVIALNAANYEEGAQLFGRASELSPDDETLVAKARFMQGRALVERRQFQQGIDVLRQVVMADPDAAYPYNALGIAYMEQQRWNEAIQNFRAASERAEKWIYPRYNLSRVYAALARYRDAEQELRTGIMLAGNLGLRYSYLHYNLGILQLFQGRANEAEQEFRRAIELKPDDAMSYHNLGLIYQRRNNSQEAEANFRRAAGLDPRLVEPRLKLAEVYRQRRDREQEEIALRDAVTADPRSAAAAEALGRFLLENRRLDEAEQTFLQLLGANPQSVVALAGLGDVHTAQGNFAQAAEDYRQAIARATDARVRRDLEQKLRAVERRR
jgi:Flp pilus assembly protein TadD